MTNSILYLLLSVTIFSSWHSGIHAADFVTHGELRAIVFDKAPPTMVEQLNILKLVTGLLTGAIDKKAVNPLELVAILEEASQNGDEVAQLNLYRILKQPLGKFDRFVDPQRAEQMLAAALVEGSTKIWALKEKIEQLEKVIPTQEAEKFNLLLEKSQYLEKAIGILLNRDSATDNLREENEKEIYSFWQKIDALGIAGDDNALNFFNKKLLDGRLWALRSKIASLELKGAGKSDEAIALLIQAAHKNDPEAIKKLNALFGDKVIFKEPASSVPWSKVKGHFSIARYQECGFGVKSQCNEGQKLWSTYGKPLFDVGMYLVTEREMFDLAEKYFKAAAELGHAQSFNSLAHIAALKGDSLRAFEFAKRGNALGDLDSRLQAAQIAFDDFPSPDNLAVAYASLKSMPLDGKDPARDLDAVTLLADLELEEFENHKPNKLLALQLARYGALKGSMVAMKILADLERDDFFGHPANFAESIFWYNQAEKEGAQGVALQLGNLHLHDFLGHQKDPALAFACFQRAVLEDDDNGQALFEIARLERQTFKGHKANPAKALILAKKSANLQNCCAMALVGELEDSNFTGHKKNTANAITWYKKSAQKRCELGWQNLLKHMPRQQYRLELLNRKPGMTCLGCLLEAGRLENEDFAGHERNPVNAIKWFTRAAKFGSVDAKFELGKIHLELGTDAHLGQALFWLHEAQAEGSKEAALLLENLAQTHTARDEIVEEQLQSLLETVVEVSCCNADQCDLPSLENLQLEDGHGDFDANLESAYLESLDFSQYNSKLNNKLERRALAVKKLTMINHKLQANVAVRLEDLQPKNQETWQNFKSGDFDNISYNDLFRFANDDALLGMFSYGPTKCGIEFTLVVTSDGKKRHGSVGTHQKHNKSYKGLNHDFLREFREMVVRVLQF